MTTPRRPRKLRSDAARNREHVVRIAERFLVDRPRATMAQIAAEANVSRGTLYRHFPTRGDLLHAVNDQARNSAKASPEDRVRPAGELARSTPTPLSVADVLNKVPPHLIGEQIVAEAQRVPSVTSAAVYLVDLDGTALRRLAGPISFPESVRVTLAVGTEVPQEGLPALQAVVHDALPGTTAMAMTLRGRAIGVLVTVGGRAEDLEDLAYEAAAALALGAVYTDAIDSARRVRPTSPAAEIQQNLLPPRIVRTNGALIAGNVLPGYEIGGDWFDYAENPSGTWIGTADATGNGARAAALASVALGAFRSGRHQRLPLAEVVTLMDTAVREVAMNDAVVAVTIGFWVPPTSTFSWVSCGELGPMIVDADGEVDLLQGRNLPPLGSLGGIGEVVARTRQLSGGDRLVLASDGVLDHTTTDGEPFGVQGVVDAVRTAPFASAAGALSAIESTVRAQSNGPTTDDATLVVLAPVLTQAS